MYAENETIDYSQNYWWKKYNLSNIACQCGWSRQDTTLIIHI